jgi:hypothetical protein
MIFLMVFKHKNLYRQKSDDILKSEGKQHSGKMNKGGLERPPLQKF